MRTTLDLDNSVLEQLRQRQRRENKTLGQVASELLARALAETERRDTESVALAWTAPSMTARVDLEDREALHRVLDTDQ